jgi:hypothetical protein
LFFPGTWALTKYTGIVAPVAAGILDASGLIRVEVMTKTVKNAAHFAKGPLLRQFPESPHGRIVTQISNLLA